LWSGPARPYSREILCVDVRSIGIAWKWIIVAQQKLNAERERRILEEIVVDAHDEEERAMGWFAYLEDRLQFPFTARCVSKRAISPLRVGDEVEVISVAPEEECEREMFVMIRWERDGLGVPLSQIKPVAADDETVRAVADWHYWIARGYEF
jgi:hypothetical protein